MKVIIVHYFSRFFSLFHSLFPTSSLPLTVSIIVSLPTHSSLFLRFNSLVLYLTNRTLSFYLLTYDYLIIFYFIRWNSLSVTFKLSFLTFVLTGTRTRTLDSSTFLSLLNLYKLEIFLNLKFL